MKRSAIVIPAVLCSFTGFTGTGLAQTAPPPAATQTAPASQTPPASTSASLTPRGPEAIAQQEPNRVVATIGGKPVTAKQAVELLQAIQPDDRKRYENKLSELVRQVYMEDETAAEAVRQKLDQQSPWKEQLQLSRANILTQAYLTKQAASTPTEDPKAYYDSHSASFDQVKLSGILVAYNPPGTPASTATIQRTEADALAKANDLEKKIKAGGDFSALARTDSDNQQSSTRGGDIGTFTMDSPNIPANIKELIAKMKPQEVSEPFRIPGGFYIFKLDNRTRLPFEQARAGIVQKQQSEKAQSLLKQQLDKYNIQVQDAEFFGGSSAAPANKIPSLARPAGAQPPPAKP